METKELLKRSASMLRNWKLLHIQEPWFKKSSVDLVVTDFLKNDTVQTKIGTIHLKFDEKIGFGQIRFFTTRRILDATGLEMVANKLERQA
jgi:hypothetical protein